MLVAASLDTQPELQTEGESVFRLQYSGLVLSVFYSVTRSVGHSTLIEPHRSP